MRIKTIALLFLGLLMLNGCMMMMPFMDGENMPMMPMNDMSEEGEHDN